MSKQRKSAGRKRGASNALEPAKTRALRETVNNTAQLQEGHRNVTVDQGAQPSASGHAQAREGTISFHVDGDGEEPPFGTRENGKDNHAGIHVGQSYARGGGHTQHAELQARERIQAPRDGVALDQETPGIIEFINTHTDRELLKLAKKSKIDDPDMAAHIPLVREMIRLGASFVRNGKIYDEHAGESLEQTVAELITDEDNAWFDQQLAGIDLDDYDVENMELNLEAYLSEDEDGDN